MAKSLEQLETNDLIVYWNDNEFKKPRLIIFDLDFTLWPYYANRYYQAPFQLLEQKTGQILVDSKLKKVHYFKDIPQILKILKENCSQELAIASRSGDRKTVEALLNALGWSKYFSSIQIYGGNKSRHIKTICSELNIKHMNEILFFDDDVENIYTTNHLGIVTHLVDKNIGLDFNTLFNGLKKYSSLKK